SLNDFSINIFLSVRAYYFKNNLSVRQVEQLVKTTKEGGGTGAVKNKTPNPLSPDHLQVEENLRNYLGTKVQLKMKDTKKGEIVISYYSNDDLNRIIELIEKD
ncbi:MAG: hypothetical protein IH946_11325, partial [Bacteroidetes bacterium]|nr:hypothetical protein [Bacteroidota bacterium]